MTSNLTPLSEPTDRQQATRKRWPPLDPARIALTNQLAGFCRPLIFRTKQRNLQVKLEPRAATVAGDLTFVLDVNGHELAVSAPPAPLIQLNSELMGIDVTDVPSDLLAALVEACLDPLVGLLQKAGIKLAVKGINRACASEPGIRWFLSGEDGAPLVAGQFWGDLPALEFLLQIWRQAPLVPLRNLAELPIHISLECGHLALTADELGQLEPGDLLLAELISRPTEGEVRLQIYEQTFALASWKNHLVTINRMSSEPPASSVNPSQASTVETIPVRLSFSLGDTSLTVRELSSIQPGYVFEVPNPGNGQVSIYANGKLFGVGEIVELGERLGVRILEIK
ncbi:MAG: type III secretion system cytoplasmic ring protein SctQ [Verrucomicrobia bacterium]|nr:type III secretion system cytoplasmic ring protein SctQ [Verrucomicrobiota bacterium]